MPTAFEYATTHAERFRHELHELLRIPSVSTDMSFAPEVRRAADWLVQHLNALGFTVELIETERHPMVYAEWMGAGDSAKTVLIYGHYDVQPAVMEDGWQTDPFEPVEKDGFIYARGATDDKGQVFAHLKALEALLKTEGKLPVNVKLIIEGEEESGSAGIRRFVPEHPEKLAADVCVVSDSSMQTIDQPVILNGLRGGILFELTVSGPSQDLHSGMFGGTVHNPALALAQMISQMHKEDLSVAIPGFYDHVRTLSKSEREQMAQGSLDNVAWGEQTGAPLPWGEADYTLSERIGARPTLEITGMAGGYFGAGFKSIVPSKAWAKISCRLVPDQDPDHIAQAMEKFIKRIAPPTVRVDLKRIGGSPAVLVDVSHPMMQAAINAYEQGWGAAPIFKREGGSIPVVGEFQTHLKLPVVLMGFGLNSDNLHGPNEHFSIEMFHKAITTAIHFLYEVAKL